MPKLWFEISTKKGKRSGNVTFCKKMQVELNARLEPTQMFYFARNEALDESIDKHVLLAQSLPPD